MTKTWHSLLRLRWPVGSSEKTSSEGVRNADKGQPPCPPRSRHGLHVEMIEVGAFLPIYLMQMKYSLRIAAMDSLRKLSRSITWHQWQAE